MKRNETKLDLSEKCWTFLNSIAYVRKLTDERWKKDKTWIIICLAFILRFYLKGTTPTCTINKSGFPSGEITLFVRPKHPVSLTLTALNCRHDKEVNLMLKSLKILHRLKWCFEPGVCAFLFRIYRPVIILRTVFIFRVVWENALKTKTAFSVLFSRVDSWVLISASLAVKILRLRKWMNLARVSSKKKATLDSWTRWKPV